MDTFDVTNEPIEELVRRYREQGMSRSRFVAALAGLGASAAGIATLISSTEANAADLRPRYEAAHEVVGKRNMRLHAAHVQRRGRATTPAPKSVRAARHLEIVNDYADHAVIEHPLLSAPIVGKAAIAQYKRAEMNSMSGVSIEVTHRFAHGSQVVAEWVLRGTHQGDFMGYRATGRKIAVRGVTVVTRENGKITRESLHYDVADVHRQLSSER